MGGENGPGSPEYNASVAAANQKAHRGRLALEAAQQWGLLVDDFDANLGRYLREGVLITEIRIACEGKEDGTRLAVIKAVVDGQRKVGFLSAYSPRELLRTILKALAAGGIRFRDERPYSP